MSCICWAITTPVALVASPMMACPVKFFRLWPMFPSRRCIVACEVSVKLITCVVIPGGSPMYGQEVGVPLALLGPVACDNMDKRR
ncbi:hypothetical protein KC19_VG031400 [Ceratodon purpureus]|uniref:Secreted protein n=1 Tax=Ceratodon purpureus TaxID=3225 RepID=A0A8T0HLG3_CERPU|nr:hypothetical protein KC19_VG031400 [Ceratodon purpureus]